MILPAALPDERSRKVPLSELADHYDGLLCDVWGVLHNGVAAFDDAVEALCRYRAQGGRVVLITNAPRPSREIYPQLERFGVPREAFDSLVTSGDVTSVLLAERPDAPLYHFGPARDRSILVDLKNPMVGVAEAELCLLTGPLDDTIETVDVYDNTLIEMRDNALEMICANPDLTVRSGSRTVICAGSIAQRYAMLGGKVVFAGKPEIPIYDEALKRISDAAGRTIPKRRILAVGDGIPTDIKGAAQKGLDAYFVASGVHANEFGCIDTDAKASEIAKVIESRCFGVSLVGICDHLRWI